MFGYLLLVALVTLGLAAGSFFLIHSLVLQGRISAYDGKGYFMVLMFVAVFISGGVAWFVGQPAVPVDLAEGEIARSSVGVLFSVAVGITALALGLLNIKLQKQFL